jgi:type IV secretory pathway protease TraF
MSPPAENTDRDGDRRPIDPRAAFALRAQERLLGVLTRKPKGFLRDARLPIAIGLVIFTAFAAMPTQFLTFNVTSSLPRGLYVKLDQPVAIGAIVRVPLPPAWRAFLEARHEQAQADFLLKPVLAVAGTEVCLTEHGNTVAGAAIGDTDPVDDTGNPMPAWRYCGPLPTGKLFLYSGVRHSLDSRYLGPVGADQVVGVYGPLLTE